MWELWVIRTEGMSVGKPVLPLVCCSMELARKSWGEMLSPIPPLPSSPKTSGRVGPHGIMRAEELALSLPWEAPQIWPLMWGVLVSQS